MSIRICEIVTNLKNDKGEDLINLDNMKELLVNRECIMKYAYIIHDKDTYTLEDESKNQQHKAGTLKSPHIHLLLKFRCHQQIGNVAKWFNIPPNNVQKVKSEAAATAYLIHANAPEKHQYELNEVISNFDVAQAIQKVQTKRSLNDVIDKILNGTICEYNKTTEIDPVMLVQQNKKIEMAFKITLNVFLFQAHPVPERPHLPNELLMTKSWPIMSHQVQMIFLTDTCNSLF